MTRYDQMPDVGHPIPKEILDADRAATEAEAKREQLRALTREFALPENLLRQRLAAAAGRKDAGLNDPTPPQYVPGLIGRSPMGTSMANSAGGIDPSSIHAHVAEMAGSPAWAKCVELAVRDLGMDADELALRERAMQFYTGPRV
jgi:hypothetical protein